MRKKQEVAEIIYGIYGLYMLQSVLWGKPDIYIITYTISNPFILV
jgi:hypothetical protein